MKHTLKETFDNEIDSYRPFGHGTTGFYTIRFDDPYSSHQIDMMSWSSEFDDYPERVDDQSDLPSDGWLHMDDCACDECESED